MIALLKSLLAVMVLAVVAGTAGADSGDWGPPEGQPLPLLEAPDQLGRLQSFDTLKGRRGMLLFMNRSTDW